MLAITKASVAVGREMMAQPAPNTADPASSTNRRARAAEAQRKNAGLIEKMKQGFGHPSTNPVANFVGKPA
jgi:hypothetical protein